MARTVVATRRVGFFDVAKLTGSETPEKHGDRATGLS
jgi:hypothetical protein